MMSLYMPISGRWTSFSMKARWLSWEKGTKSFEDWTKNVTYYPLILNVLGCLFLSLPWTPEINYKGEKFNWFIVLELFAHVCLALALQTYTWAVSQIQGLGQWEGERRNIKEEKMGGRENIRIDRSREVRRRRSRESVFPTRACPAPKLWEDI